MRANEVVVKQGSSPSTESAPSAAQQYLDLYESSPYRRTKVQHIAALLGQELRNLSILDFGAGGGYMSLHCARYGADVVAIEDDPFQVKKAKALIAALVPHARCEFIVDHRLPEGLRARRFDVVLAKDVLEHVPADAELVRQFAACQQSGGRLLISTQNWLSLNYFVEGFLYNKSWKGTRDWFGWDDSHVRFYTPASLRRLLAETGYAPVEWRSTWIVPYDVLRWVSLLRVKRELPVLRWIDLSLGRWFPFNRLGWNLIVLAQRI
jgi:2-polyprenyl-6-hydroxyphenyl methylase/3-demethylubiquinone-9 3-methyltransferase